MKFHASIIIENGKVFPVLNDDYPSGFEKIKDQVEDLKVIVIKNNIQDGVIMLTVENGKVTNVEIQNIPEQFHSMIEANFL